MSLSYNAIVIQSREHPGHARFDVNASPFVVFWELTRACDLACSHCRAAAQPRRHRNELTTPQAFELIDQFTQFPQKPVLVLTGGDPLKRDDLPAITQHATQRGLTVAMAASVTPLMTADALKQLKLAGLKRLALSLDGVDADTHDGIRGVPGSFDRTRQIAAEAVAMNLPLQINTTIMRSNVDQVDELAEMLIDWRIVLWAVFFLVPVGRGQADQRIPPLRYEQVFEQLWQHAQAMPYSIKTTEAHHYRRYVLQHHGNPQRGAGEARQFDRAIQRAPLGVSDGKGCMFISHVGQVFPSGFLPRECGRFPTDSVVDTYQNAPLFRALRDADQLKGKCRQCAYRHVCGGSRARAFCLTGDPLAAEPDCIYQPRATDTDASPIMCG